MKEAILQVIKQFAILAAVAAVYACIRRWDDARLVSAVPFAASAFSAPLLSVLDRQLWQFIYAMIGLTVLSRGNLWSTGINSMNVRSSLMYLLAFYAAASVILIVLAAASSFVQIRYDQYPAADRLLVMTIQWLSSPVADQILFFGLFQTALMKFWNDTVTISGEEFPSVILITAMAFALGRTGLPHYAAPGMEYAAGFAVGLFSGIVYYKTRSLLAPMLAQAFFFGMPDALHIIFSSIGFQS